MTIGIGGSTPEQELVKLSSWTIDLMPITADEIRQRQLKAQSLMAVHNIDALYLNAGTNLYYFTGLDWYASERMVGAVLTRDGKLFYIAPHFELGTLSDYLQIEAEIVTWHEHESPYELLAATLAENGIASGKLAIDESSPFFLVDGIQKACVSIETSNALPVTQGCRGQKSATELAIMQRAMDMTLEVQKAVARILYEGISTQEVTEFIDKAHRKLGATGGSYFCIVLFGEDSSYPHGVKTPKTLEAGDAVLIDTGCELFGYHSDITRTYVFGNPSDKQRQIWALEKQAQLAAFDAAKLGEACGQVDDAARDVIVRAGLGPDYQLPGLPHRTGHGIGLEIHEGPYLVASETTLLAEGMCFSNEPMICIPDEFGIRLEDHFYMTSQGPKWFTQPSYSIDDPFGYQKR
ncbi:aminopeptidase P family protein [Parashewanella curva]|uniref:Aminopeptidase P family protein n=1 Tax=Parashewanella curva TaxID=2338552 RepID=A0A3L8Q137_9GAMM|nr:Xaa-Pro peptidase family protein [Parashewanella curva]RLV61351.1 aminopeptidase P family protein [Parashewanella curva]